MRIDKNLVVLTVVIAICGISMATTITYYQSHVTVKVKKFEDRFDVSFKSIKYDELDFHSGKIWIMGENYTRTSNTFSVTLSTNPEYRVNMHMAEIDMNKRQSCNILAESWLRNGRINESINVSTVIAYAKMNDSCTISLGDLLSYIFNVDTELKLNGKKFCIISYKVCSPSWKKCWLDTNVTNEDKFFVIILLSPSKYNETLVFSTAVYSD